MSSRYTADFRRALVERTERERPSPQELRFLLKQAQVPMSTYRVWRRKWALYGQVEDRLSGRPPAGFRRIVQEEVERSFRKWFGEPRRPSPASK